MFAQCNKSSSPSLQCLPNSTGRYVPTWIRAFLWYFALTQIKLRLPKLLGRNSTKKIFLLPQTRPEINWNTVKRIVARCRSIFPSNLDKYFLDFDDDLKWRRRKPPQNVIAGMLFFGKGRQNKVLTGKNMLPNNFPARLTTKPVTRRILLVMGVLQYDRVSWRDRNAAKCEKYYGGRGKTHTPIISRSSARKFLLSFKLKLFGAIILIILMMLIQMHSITLAHDIDNDIVSIDSINLGVFFL